MKIIKLFISIIIFLFSFFNISYSNNSNELYKKIDLFSEVLEKIQNEYIKATTRSSLYGHGNVDNETYVSNDGMFLMYY